MSYKRERGNSIDLSKLTADQLALLRSQVTPPNLLTESATAAASDTLDAALSGDLILGNVSVAALDSTGEVKCGSLRIESAPSASVATPSTHKIGVNLNGTTDYILLSNV